MVDKYDALAQLEALPSGPTQDRALRAAAQRWPGCLRESQLAGPIVCQKRRFMALEGTHEEKSSRAKWQNQGFHAIPLWIDLHQLFMDQLRWRKGFNRLKKPKVASPLEDFFRFTQKLPGNSRWPTEFEQLQEIGGNKVCSFQAYSWLAVQAGIPLFELSHFLFNREKTIKSRTY